MRNFKTRQRWIHAQFLAKASGYSIASRLSYTEFIDKTCLALVVSPAVNTAMLFIGLFCTPVISRLSAGASVLRYVCATILLPFIAAASVFGCVFLMDLHGC